MIFKRNQSMPSHWHAKFISNEDMDVVTQATTKSRKIVFSFGRLPAARVSVLERKQIKEKYDTLNLRVLNLTPVQIR